MTKQEKIRKLTGSPLWASKTEAATLAESMTGPDITAILKIVEKRIRDQDEMIANRLSQLYPEERDVWIKNWRSPDFDLGIKSNNSLVPGDAQVL